MNLAIYTRLSKLDDESNSIENQIAEGKAYAYKNDLDDNQIYIYDEGEGIKGSDPIEKRPALIKMMNDIKAGKITMVYVRKQSRLSRKLRMFNDILEDLIDYKVTVFMGDKGLLDLTSPMTKMMLQIMSAFDEYAPNQQSVETIRALKNRAEEGKTMGILPYGYSSDDNGYPIIIESEAKVVKMIYDMYINTNKGMQAIANELNKLNIPTTYQRIEDEADDSKILSNRKHRNGVIWQSSTILNVLSNRAYLGERLYQNILYPDFYKPIITKTIFNKAQQARKSKKHRKLNSKPKYDYLLAGLLKCGKCGRNWVGRFKQGTSKNFYSCISQDNKSTNCKCPSANIYKLESFILKHLFKTKELEQMIKTISANDSAVTSVELLLNDAKSNLNEATATKKRYLKLLGTLEGDEDIIKEYEDAKSIEQNLQTKVDNLQIELNDLTNSETLKKYNESLAMIDGKTDFRTLKMAVDNIIDHITIDGMKSNFDAEDITDGSLMSKFNNKTNIFITIHYRGLTEVSTWMSPRPLNFWMNTNNTLITNPNIDELPEDYVLTDDDMIQSPLTHITLTDDDIVMFNLTKKEVAKLKK
ncbi:recombinase family protein [Psychroserpens mesophilus]|uniref:recombinase family protein n=1 Tax=Psychroserpens mesophilus TaxID=325473 RepID=UPI003D652B7E